MNKQSLDTDPRWTDSILVKLCVLVLLIDVVDITCFSVLRLASLVKSVVQLNGYYFGICFLIVRHQHNAVLKKKEKVHQSIIKNKKFEKIFLPVFLFFLEPSYFI